MGADSPSSDAHTNAIVSRDRLALMLFTPHVRFAIEAGEFWRPVKQVARLKRFEPCFRSMVRLRGTTNFCPTGKSKLCKSEGDGLCPTPARKKFLFRFSEMCGSLAASRLDEGAYGQSSPRRGARDAMDAVVF